MKYRCPLCLKELSQKDILGKWCSTHAEQGEINGYAIASELPCNDSGCAPTSSIEEGIFLFHKGCKSQNPFWHPENKQITIDGDERQSNAYNYSFSLDNGPTINTRIVHWEIGMLRSVKAVPEMWFPSMLLRATAEINSGSAADGHRIGALVGLAGAKGSGKTVIAMQTLDVDAYCLPQKMNQRLEIADYIFSRSDGKTVHPCLKTLALRTLMRANQPNVFLAAVGGTSPVAGDLKVAFFTPVTIEVSKKALTKRGITREFGKIFSSAHSESRDPFKYTLALYDLAGESAESEDKIAKAAVAGVDKMAVVIDATDILDAKKDANLSVAVQWLDLLRSRKKPHALVVTKLDLVTSQIANEKSQLDEVAGNLVEVSDGKARDMLIRWLQTATAPNQAALRALLRQNEAPPVFFIWTINLTGSGQSGISNEQPRSYGLARFVCWCLGVPWQAINHA